MEENVQNLEGKNKENVKKKMTEERQEHRISGRS